MRIMVIIFFILLPSTSHAGFIGSMIGGAVGASMASQSKSSINPEPCWVQLGDIIIDAKRILSIEGRGEGFGSRINIDDSVHPIVNYSPEYILHIIKDTCK